MVFGFLKSLIGPEGGYRAIQASYDKHYSLALKQRIEPVSMGLFGALGSRYKLRGKFINDMVHMVEIVPFMMMDDHVRVEALADYLMADEIPDQIDIGRLKDRINNAFRNSNAESAEDSYKLLIASMPYLQGSGIRWFAWLDTENSEKLRQDCLKEMDEKE